MHESAVVALAGIGLISIACQWLAWWVKLPAIMFLLVAGLVAGPITGWLDPDALFGDLLLPMVSLAVAVILFEGALTLHLDEIRGLERVVRRMVTTGLVVTWVVIALATRWLIGLPWELAFLFGAVVVVTGPTVIVPMLRTVRPTARVANVLRWEGIVIDPIGALLAVLVFEFIVSGRGGAALEHTLLIFGQVIVFSVIAGVAAGYVLGLILRNHWLPEFLHNVATLTLVFGVFAGSNAVQPESGLLTVTVMGLWLTNMKGVTVENIMDFKETLSVLLISGLFVILAARMDLAQIQSLGWAAVGVLAVVQFVARPLKVLVSAWGSALSWPERALVAWIGPRGIVAAAVAAVFSIRLQEQGYAEAGLLVPLAFLIILGTVVVQSGTARLIARALGVAEPEPRGFLMVGANPVARAIAKALGDQGYRTVLADTHWDHVRAARMAGLSTYYGNAVSEHADRHLDLVGVGRLLALAPQREVNALACMRYRSEFGPESVFAVAPASGKEDDEKVRVPAPQRCRMLFGEDVSYAKLSSLLSQGAEIHDTKLSEDFDFAAYLEKYKKRAIPLFAISPRDRIHPFTPDSKLEPGSGWTVIGLIQADSGDQQEENDANSAKA